MKTKRTIVVRSAPWAAAVLLAAIATEASAQNSSLMTYSAGQQGLTLADSSWTYRKPEEVKPLQKNDLITVLVDYSTRVVSEGEMDRKKKAHGDLQLKDWVLLKGFAAIPDPQTLGDPRINASIDNKMRSEATLETRDTMKFSIACRVVDIRPNGNLILEGRRKIRNNLEEWDIALGGEVRPKDVLPNNTVLSENVAELDIYKREAGHVRDGYRRGWLLQWLDYVQPF